MDSIYAIVAGLALRVVVDNVSDHDVRLVGSIIGLWEGVILLHFLKKMPKSNDPFIAYAVRLFIDLVVTESVGRMVLVIIWTGMGMVLADVTPAIWHDVGLRRIWRRFRRDVYTFTRMMPRIAFFPPPRTVRFSPSRREEEELEVEDVDDAATVSQAPSPPPPVPPNPIPLHQHLRRRVPGHYAPTDFSDTETEVSFRRSPRTSGLADVDESISDINTSENLFTNSSSSSSTIELPESDLIPAMDVEEEVETAPINIITQGISIVEAGKPEDPTTPTQRRPMFLPPTPSDSAARFPLPPRERATNAFDPMAESLFEEGADAPLPTRPHSHLIPQIPDTFDGDDAPSHSGTLDGWVQVEREDGERPPTPPEKDRPVGGSKKDKGKGKANETEPSAPLPPLQLQDDPWAEVTQSQIFDAGPTSNFNNNIQPDIPPPYATFDAPPIEGDNKNYLDDDFGDDMYWDGPEPATTGANINNVGTATEEGVVIPEGAEPSRPFFDLGNTGEQDAEAEAERQRRAAEEEEERQREEEMRVAKEAEEKLRLEEEERRLDEEVKRLEEEAEKARLAQEEEDRKKKDKEEKRALKKKKQDEEKAARKKKEEEDEAARQQKREEDAAKEAVEAAAEQKRLEDEAEQKRLAAEAEQKRQEEEAAEAERKHQEEAAEAEAKRIKDEEEAEKQRLADVAEAAEKGKRLADAQAATAGAAAEIETPVSLFPSTGPFSFVAPISSDPIPAPVPSGIAPSLSTGKGVISTFGDSQAQKDAQKEQRAKDALEAEERRENLRKESIDNEAQWAAERNMLEEEAVTAGGVVKKKRRRKTLGVNAPATDEEAAGLSEPPTAGRQSLTFEDMLAADQAKLNPGWEGVGASSQAPSGEAGGEAQGGDDIDKDDAKTAIAGDDGGVVETTAPGGAQTVTGQSVTQEPEGEVEAPVVPPAPYPEEPSGNTDDPEQQAMETATEASVVSAVPSDVDARVKRMLLQRAQMVQLQQTINDLKEKDDPASAAELKASEKVMRKYVRQLERRYESGIALAEFLHSGFDAFDAHHASLEGLHPKVAEQKIDEHLEYILTPTTNSLTLTLQITKKAADARRQKSKLVDVLEYYCLSPYAMEGLVNKKFTIIEVPESEFENWLSAFRQKHTAADAGEDTW